MQLRSHRVRWIVAAVLVLGMLAAVSGTTWAAPDPDPGSDPKINRLNLPRPAEFRFTEPSSTSVLTCSNRHDQLWDDCGYTAQGLGVPRGDYVTVGIISAEDVHGPGGASSNLLVSGGENTSRGGVVTSSNGSWSFDSAFSCWRGGTGYLVAHRFTGTAMTANAIAIGPRIDCP